MQKKMGALTMPPFFVLLWASADSAVFRNGRQQDVNLGIIAIMAFEDKFAAMVRDNTVTDSKPEAGTNTGRLGREERIVNFVEDG